MGMARNTKNNMANGFMGYRLIYLGSCLKESGFNSEFLKDTGFYNLQFMQTVFNSIKQIKAIEPVLKGFGKGSFVVVCAEKRSVPTQ